jgi:hypothetical protein
VLCPPRSVILSVGCDQQPLQVEVSLSRFGFRKIGELTASPIYDSNDWKSESPALRAPFDAVTACLERNPSLLGAGDNSRPLASSLAAVSSAPSHVTQERAPVPWILLAGLLGGLLVAVARLRALPGGSLARPALLLAVLAVACFFLRRWLIPTGFFHQNGQGPFWIGFALESSGSRSQYGPGYWEVFGRLARLPPDPETPVFLVQALTGALAPVLVWALLFEARVRGGLLWGTTVAVAALPILGRVAQSESYCGVCTTLLLGACLLLVSGAGRADGSRVLAVIAVASAGLLIAQGARITPATWAPAAFTPLVLFASPLRPRQAVWRVALATAGIGLTVLVLDRSEMSGILSGAVGQHWLPQLIDRLRGIGWATALAPLLLAGFVWWASDRARAVCAAVALGVAFIAIEGTRVVWEERPTINRGFLLFWLPLVLALTVALAANLRTGRPRQIVSAVLLTAFLAADVSTWRADTVLPTDSLEAGWAREWRHLLPQGATVVYVALSMASARDLPLYGIGSPVPIERWALTAGRPAPISVAKLGPDVYYYESSLCSAEDAGDTCRQVHRNFDLDVVAQNVFPAIPSNRGEHFTKSEIPVALYRMGAAHPPTAAIPQ